VRVTIVSPGAVESELKFGSTDADAAAGVKAFYDANQIPGRCGRPCGGLRGGAAGERGHQRSGRAAGVARLLIGAGPVRSRFASFNLLE
jgi:hypothetical protein